MKNLMKIAAFVALAFTMNACDWFEDKVTKDITFNSELSEDVQISEDASTVVESTVVLDPLTDEEFEEYQEAIKSIEITKLAYTVSELTTAAEGVTFSGKVEYSAGAGSKRLLATLTNVDIAALANSGLEQTLDVPESEIADIVSIFREKNSITVHFSGELSEVPVEFNLELKAYLKVVAEIGI